MATTARHQGPRLIRPRVYSVRITMKSGKVIDKMLGVAFNNVERQRCYDGYKMYAWWSGMCNDFTIKDVEFRSDKLNA